MNLYIVFMTVAAIDFLIFTFSKTVEGKVKWGFYALFFLLLALHNKPL